jgi:hypothetical protein
MLYGEARAESGDHILTPSKESRARLMKGATGCMPSESGYVGNQSSFWLAIVSSPIILISDISDIENILNHSAILNSTKSKGKSEQ